MNPWEQGLYWNNFPVKPKKHFGFLKDDIKRTNIATKTYPYLIYTGIKEINFLWIYQNEELLQGLKKTGLHIFLYEPVSYYLKDPTEFNHGYYSEIPNGSEPHAMCGELDSIQDFMMRTGIVCTVHTCDYKFNYYYQKKYPLLNIVTEDVFIKTHTRPPKDVYFVKDIKKKFVSIIGRYTPHRHMIMCYMADKPGHYVWRYQTDFDDMMNKCVWNDNSLPYDYLRKQNEIVNNNIWKIDYNIEHKTVKDLNGGTEGVHSYNDEMVNAVNESFVMIVNETRFAQPTGNVSEKTFQAFNGLSPLILAAPPHSLEYLHDLGFRTFNNWWDESYDKETNHNKRLLKIFNLIDEINNKSLNELKDMYKDMMPTIEYNRMLMDRFNVREKVIYK